MVEISIASIGANVFFRFVKLPSGKIVYSLVFFNSIYFIHFFARHCKYRCTFQDRIEKSQISVHVSEYNYKKKHRKNDHAPLNNITIIPTTDEA